MICFSEQCTPLVIFTHAFPFEGVEVSFLQNELKVLAKHFTPVILVPRNIGGKKVQIPHGVVLDESFSSLMTQSFTLIDRISTVYTSRSFFRELLANPSILSRPRIAKRLFRDLFDAQLTQNWVEKKLEESNYIGKWIFYTYWLGKYTFGIGNARKNYPQIRLVSRVHRGDLYAREENSNYLPLQKVAIKTADRVISVSENGLVYLKNKYPWAQNLGVSRLGVDGPINPSVKSSDGIFRIVSCSGLRPVKRVDLLARGLYQAAKIRPSQIFQWDHFGDGETRPLVENEIGKFPNNIHHRLWGHVNNESILDYYEKNPVDLFINVSLSEGLPVSIMEAFSCGIPVLATEVGGTPEIVTPNCGWLLTENPGSEDIAEMILKCVDDPDGMIRKRIAAQEMWQTNFNASSNFDWFAQILKFLIS